MAKKVNKKLPKKEPVVHLVIKKTIFNFWKVRHNLCLDCLPIIESKLKTGVTFCNRVLSPAMKTTFNEDDVTCLSCLKRMDKSG